MNLRHTKMSNMMDDIKIPSNIIKAFILSHLKKKIKASFDL